MEGFISLRWAILASAVLCSTFGQVRKRVFFKKKYFLPLRFSFLTH